MGHRASTAGGTGSIPGGGSKIPHAAQRGQKKKKSSHSSDGDLRNDHWVWWPGLPRESQRTVGHGEQTSEKSNPCCRNVIKNKISCQHRKPLHKGRRGRKLFFNWMRIKPECHRQSAPEFAKMKRNCICLHSQADTTHCIHFLKIITSPQARGCDSTICHTGVILNSAGKCGSHLGLLIAINQRKNKFLISL